MTNQDTNMFPRHGLKGNTKQRVFDALLEKQDGRCFICDISQAEIEGKLKARFEKRRQEIEALPTENEYRQDALTRLEKGPAPVHTTLHIDHCHSTGMIRGLLCEHCNYAMMYAENWKFLENTGPYKPSDMDAITFTQHCTRVWHWLYWNKERVLEYMQLDRWLPRKDILFHLQKVSISEEPFSID